MQYCAHLSIFSAAPQSSTMKHEGRKAGNSCRTLAHIASVYCFMHSAVSELLMTQATGRPLKKVSITMKVIRANLRTQQAGGTGWRGEVSR